MPREPSPAKSRTSRMMGLRKLSSFQRSLPRLSRQVTVSAVGARHVFLGEEFHLMSQHSARHTFNRRTFLQATALGLSGARPSAASPEGELLYNGIRLAAGWPPRRAYSPNPVPPPYLDKPPAV